MWHQLTADARKQEQLVVLGVIQEQHAERCRLYAQWQNFDWMIVQDPINLLRARAVPMFVALNEDGVVVDANLRTNEYKAFLDQPPAKLQTSPQSKSAQTELVSNAERRAETLTKLETKARSSNNSRDWEALGDHLLLWESPDKISDAIANYLLALNADPESPTTAFSLGVAYRKRFDSDYRQANDFQNAVAAWEKALKLDPNQYIYRRRIQQYGPRLIKPYPFYDWVDNAIEELQQAGKTPVKWRVLPTGAEIAQPSRELVISKASSVNPDPEGRITRDVQHNVLPSVVVVPGQIKPGATTRVHLSFAPTRTAHWNNESEPMCVWLDLPEGWETEQLKLEFKQPQEPETSETRTVEFELKAPLGMEANVTLTGFALYYICEDVSGQCLYRRSDFSIPIRTGN